MSAPRSCGCLELGVCNARVTPCATCADAAYQQNAIAKAVAREVKALAEPSRTSAVWDAVFYYAIVITATAATVAVVLGGAGFIYGRLTA